MATEQPSTTYREQVHTPEMPANGNADAAVPVIKSDWRTVPYWFAALAGFVYGTGFLVDFTFLTLMGIKDPMTDIVKARHIYVGLLCLQFPVSFCVVLLGFLRLKRKALNQSTSSTGFVKPNLPSILTVFVLLFSFFLLIAFSRPGSSYAEHQIALFLLFSLAIIGLILARGIEDFVKNIRAKHQSVDDALKSIPTPIDPLIAIRWLLFLTVFILMTYIFWPLWSLLGEMVKEGAYLYVGLIGMVALILWRIDKRFDAYSRQGLRVTMIAITLAICLAFTYFAILVFAARIYPYIPAGRGGGDYTIETPSLLVFDNKFKDALPIELIDNSAPGLQSKPLYILRDTADVVFVAVPTEADQAKQLPKNGPEQWRKLGKQNKPRVLYGIKREAIVCTIYKE